MHGLVRTLYEAPFARPAVLALVLAACWGSDKVEAPPPMVVEDVLDSLPAAEPSIVDSEIRYDLGPAIASLEVAVPRSFGDIDKRIQAGNSRAYFAFVAERSPFQISLDGQRVAISGTIEYAGRGWFRPPIGPVISAACGTGGVEKPRARIRIASTIGLTPSWSLSSKSRVVAVEPFSDASRDHCRVTPFRIDVTDRVMRATRGVLESQLQNLDRNIAMLNTRERFEQWWRSMSRPIRLTDSVWLTLNPSDVRMGSVSYDSGSVVARLSLTVQPKIETGNRPNDFDLFKPLPKLVKGNAVGRKLLVTLDGELGYDVANPLLRKAIVGKKVELGDRSIVVRDVELTGIGGGRVALGVRFGGSASGIVYLTGTPKYDSETDQLMVPDLAYDLHTNDMLVRGVAWLKDAAIQDFLRERARFPVDDQLDRLRQLAENGMNRDLSKGVTLIANLDRARAVSVRATRRALLVRAEASGWARLDIDRPMGLKRPQRPKTAEVGSD